MAAIGVLLFVAAEPYRTARVVKFFDPDLKIVTSIDHQGHIKKWVENSL